MPAITEAREQKRALLQERVHGECLVCRSSQLDGLGVNLRADSEGNVEGTFDCNAFYQGYDGILHGGVICTILDAAMTHCLFAREKCGVTARLIVRFLKPASTGRPATVRARLCDYSPPLYILEAELRQNGEVVAQATAKFIDREQV